MSAASITKVTGGGSTSTQPVRRSGGLARMAALLDAADEIAIAQGLSALSLPAVAARAGASPSSLYHFFPTLEALCLALLRRYNALEDRAFDQLAGQGAATSGWQEMACALLAAGRAFHDAHPVYAQLMRRAAASEALRSEDDAHMLELGARFQALLQTRFHLPPIPHLAERLGAAAAMADRLWAFLPEDNGKISDFAFEESRRALISYLANYLPGELTPKDTPP